MFNLSSPDLATLRNTRYSLRRYLAFVPRTIIFQAQVNGTPESDGSYNAITALQYDNVTLGAHTDIFTGFTLEVGTAAGLRDVGTFRVRGTPTSNTIGVNATAPGLANVLDNQYITVRREFRPWQITFRIEELRATAGYVTDFTEFWDHDGTDVTNSVNVPPKANITRDSSGNPVQLAGFVDAGQTYRTITLDSSLSAAPWSSVSSRVWTVGDCTITVGTSTSTAITLRVPVGFRYIFLTVTAANGKTSVRALPLWTFDTGSNQPFNRFEVRRDSRNEWREMDFEVFGADDSTDESIIPYGATVCYWEEVSFNGTDAPVQYIGQALLYAKRDGVQYRRYNGRYMMETAGIGYFLDKFESPAVDLVDTGADPAKFYELRNITVDKAAYIQLFYNSNYHLLANMFFSGDTSIIESLSFSGGSLWRQIVELAKRISGVAATDSQGGLWLRQHYSYLTSSQRTARGRVFTSTRSDWIYESAITIMRELLRPVGWVRAGGSSWGGSGEPATFESRAYGLRQDYGPSREEMPYQMLPTSGAQTELNRRSGHHIARLNNPEPDVSLALLPNLDVVEPAWNMPIALTYDVDSIRGDQLNAVEYLVRGVEVRHSNKPGEVPKAPTYRMERVTSGNPGEAFPIEVSSTSPTTAPNSAFRRSIYPAQRRSTTPGLADVAILGDNGNWYEGSLAVAGNWSAASAGLTGTPQGLAYDAFSPPDVAAWAGTSSRLLKITDIDGTPTNGTATTLTVTAAAESLVVVTERGIQNFVAASWYNAGVYYAYTTDGNTWTQTTLGSSAGAFFIPRGIHIQVNGVVFINAYNGTASRIYRSTNQLATAPTDIGISLGTGAASALGIKSSVADTSWIYHAHFSATVRDIRRSAADGSSSTVINATYNSNSYGLISGEAFVLADDDPDTLLAALYNSTANTSHLFITRNARATAPTWTPLELDTLYTRMYSLNRNTFILLGTGRIAVIRDGQTIEDRTGNFPSGVTPVGLVGI